MLSAIRDSFLISENTPGYELKLRSALSDIWFQIFELALPLMQTKDRFDKRNKRLRLMMVYIHEHYAEKISVKDIAGTAFASERECFRLFHDCLHMSPAEYIKNYRPAICSQIQENISLLSARAAALEAAVIWGKFSVNRWDVHRTNTAQSCVADIK